jgi:hypothetical protein
MGNPTGTVYLQANSNYVWTDGDVYEIPQTDLQEGAATGASFSGLGVDNQPHQVLLNKIQVTHNKQVTDEVSILLLQQFQGLFTSHLAPFGWLKAGVTDDTLGLVTGMVQWGSYGLGTELPSDAAYTFNWPYPFPAVCLWAGGVAANPAGDFTHGNATLEVIGFTRTSVSFGIDWTGFVQTAPHSRTMAGFYYLAIGR